MAIDRDEAPTDQGWTFRCDPALPVFRTSGLPGFSDEDVARASISLGEQRIGSEKDKGSVVTGQKESEARPTDRGWTAILRQDARTWHYVGVSARQGLQRSVPSDQGCPVHLVRVQILIAVVLPRGALLEQE